jgi:hypothetical protein
MFNVYKNQQSRQTGSRNLMGPKTLPMIWVPIWSLWPNIRFLPSIVAEKNVTKNVHICSIKIKTLPNLPFFWNPLSENQNIFYTPAPRRGRGVYCFTSVRPSVQDIFRRIFKLTRTVFSLVAMLNFYLPFQLISHSNVCQNSSTSPARLKTEILR